MVFKLILNLICGVSKITNYILSVLPLLYSVITILFIILGIAGVIAFAFGIKFKSLARNLYGFIHLMTTGVIMLILFNLTYCSLILPTNTQDKGEVPPKNSNSFVGKSIKPIKDNILKTITKVLNFLNNLLDNISGPLIIPQVLCTTIIVLFATIMSAIFSGISKACYKMQCTGTNQYVSVPWWGKLVDLLMYLLLFISSIFVVLYFILKLIKEGFRAITSGFGLKSQAANTEKSSTNNLQDKMPPFAQKAFAKLNSAMNEWPTLRAIFIISLSYYLIQLFLTWFEDIISNNIVLLTSWDKRQPVCGDWPNIEMLTRIERIAVLILNILLFILLLTITLGLLFVNAWFSPVIINILKVGPRIYIPVSAALSAPVSLDSIRKTITKASKGKINVQKLETKAYELLSKVEKGTGNLDINQITSVIKQVVPQPPPPQPQPQPQPPPPQPQPQPPPPQPPPPPPPPS